MSEDFWKARAQQLAEENVALDKQNKALSRENDLLRSILAENNIAFPASATAPQRDAPMPPANRPPALTAPQAPVGRSGSRWKRQAKPNATASASASTSGGVAGVGKTGREQRSPRRVVGRRKKKASLRGSAHEEEESESQSQVLDDGFDAASEDTQRESSTAHLSAETTEDISGEEDSASSNSVNSNALSISSPAAVSSGTQRKLQRKSATQEEPAADGKKTIRRVWKAFRKAASRPDSRPDSSSGEPTPPSSTPTLSVAAVEGDARRASAASTDSGASSLNSSSVSISGPTSASLPMDRVMLNGAALTVQIMGTKKSGKHTFYMVGVNRQGDVQVVPRRISHFKELWAALVRQLGEGVVPELSVKKSGKAEKDLVAKLQEYLDTLMQRPSVVNSRPFARFLDPLVRPSPMGLQMLDPLKMGKMQMMVTALTGKSWRSHYFILCDSLFYFKSEEDAQPAGVMPLEYVTIEIVREKESGWPPHVFKVIDLLAGSETFFGLDTTKQVGEWILALREAKVNKMGLGYWVKEKTEDGDAEEEEEVSGRRGEVARTKPRFVHYLQLRKDPKHRAELKNAPEKTEAEFRHVLHAMPILVQWDEEESALNTLYKEKDGERVLLGLSRSRLLQCVLSPAMDAEFTNGFLFTYRMWLTPQQLFLTMLRRFRSLQSDKDEKGGGGGGGSGWTRNTAGPMQQRVVSVLTSWVTLHFYDFAYEFPMTRALLDFLIGYLGKSLHYKKFVDIMDDKIRETLVDDARRTKQRLKAAPQPILPDMYHRNMFDFIDLHPLEVARQLSILEFNLLSAIENRELLGQCWTKKNKEELAPNVLKVISRFNQMSGWITSLLVKVKALKPRVALLKRFIDIAQHCLELNNFNSVVEIVSSLGTTAVRRLTDTWAALPEETSARFQAMKDMLETKKNWAVFRARLAQAELPCIPYLGLYLTDLVMIAESSKDKVESEADPNKKLLNWEQAMRIAKVQQQIRNYQSTPYCLKPVSYFQEYLMRLDRLSEEECYQLSLAIQPRKKQ